MNKLVSIIIGVSGAVYLSAGAAGIVSVVMSNPKTHNVAHDKLTNDLINRQVKAPTVKRQATPTTNISTIMINKQLPMLISKSATLGNDFA